MNTSSIQETDPVHNYNMNCLTIMDMIARVHKNKQINEGDIVEWVAECETDYLQDIDNMIGFSGIGLTVTRGKALMPCNVYRVMTVYTQRGNRGTQPPFRRVGRWLYFNNDFVAPMVYIDYYGVRVDESGYPVVMESHKQALEAFCVYKLYYEDFLLGKMQGMAWGVIQEDMINKCRETIYDFRRFTQEDLNQLHYIQYNMVPKIGLMELPMDNVNTHFIEE